jgi:hypothetical protein
MDNFFKQCPAKMSDGRLFTDYRTATRREEYVKYINNIVRDDEHRMFNQCNAELIMDGEWQYNKKNKSCQVAECVHTYPTRMYPPWFVEERLKYDSLSNPSRKVRYSCDRKPDYRMVQTSDSIKDKQ